MDLRKLKTLIDLVAESNIAELEITEGEGKVRIVKSGPPMMVAPVASQTATPAMTAAPPVPAPAAPASAPDATPAAPAPEDAFPSPMVGTFYRASAPGAAPYVNVGDVVEVGQTLGVIEAMKLMNEIPSDRAGVVKAILIENGQAVEFGQPLFVIA
jgi:acetyl-CoA carboxylase biotin carboxyl carrier protein